MLVIIWRTFLFSPISSASSRCGPQPNSKLLINYGFVDEDNSYDRMVVEVNFCTYSSVPAMICLNNHVVSVTQASLNTEDPQYQDKRLAAQRNGKLSVQKFQVKIPDVCPSLYDICILDDFFFLHN